MSRILDIKRIYKQRTKEKMREALSALIHMKHTLHIPPDDGDADIVSGRRHLSLAMQILAARIAPGRE